ncbi:MAG: glycoside hydrolase family 2 [Planctomycetota bacterium]|nr:MAG: glycoside hydrolase family 2 [Planctomycetota bacterium]
MESHRAAVGTVLDSGVEQMKRLTAATLIVLFFGLATQCLAQQIVDQWRYTLRRPDARWHQPSFDDSTWQEGWGGFGTRDTPGARVGTVWATRDIWLRKQFELDRIPERPALLIHHDEDAQVFLNGHRVAEFAGYVTEYRVVPLDDAARAHLRVGKNVMAVHCRQTGGGQFIDVHLVDADRVPELPPAKRNTRPFLSPLITAWGEQVTADNAWREYPRPQLQRDAWQNLNGHWDYAITPIEQQQPPSAWTGQILVPFCLESKLGGVQRLLDPSEALWYRRTFSCRTDSDQRTLLNFEAVDYRCQVWVNGQSVGSHVGGNTPFSFDVTGAIRDGQNELLVRVEDATEGWQLRGKQTLNPRGIWYTQVSGIWQTVWLEQVPQQYLERVKIDTQTDGTVTVHLAWNTPGEDSAVVRAIVRRGDREVARTRGRGSQLQLQIVEPELWSPDSPALYGLEIQAGDDHVTSYFGIREIGKVRDADGHWRFTLNGQPLFHWGTLDQGWWPDGLLTPPSDEAMQYDVQWLKDAGFNMIRKHIKVEPRRYYYHCDRIGMLVWQDHVSGGLQQAWPAWTRLKPNPVDGTWPEDQHRQFMLELDRMITALESHPSIVVWVPFNERWGQHRTMEVGRWTVARDPSRLVNIASGGNFWPVGDVVDAHHYPHPEFPFEDGAGGRFDDFVKVIGEFGGHGFPVVGHLWDANRRNWGYGGLPQSLDEYKQRYVTSLDKLNELRASGIAAGIYTQTTDVEGEINGLLTYDRKIAKIPAKELAALHRRLFDQPPPAPSTPTR